MTSVHPLTESGSTRTAFSLARRAGNALVLAVAVFGIGAIQGCGKKGGEGTPTVAITGEPTKVVAQVAGEKITLGEINRVVQAWRMGRFRDVDPNAPEPVLQQKAVDNLVDQKLLMQAAKAKGVLPTEDELNAAMEQIKMRFPDEAAFAQALQQQGVTEEEVKDGFRSDMTIRRFIESTFQDTVKVTPEQAKGYFDGHPEEFQRPEMVHARHILVRAAADAPAVMDKEARDRAAAILKRLQKGEDFATVASETSEDVTAQRGGDLGFFARGQMVAPFDSVAFALQPGQISDLVKTQFGYHVIKNEERREPGTFEFDQVAPQLMQKLRQDRTDDAVKAFLEGQKKKAKIKREI
ncbi:MAG: peptidylprolyl isomerase [Candidatus Eisenbacteria bacterium]|nr:peptidylprolyl isomerase [Candidatus Eisenbacteria bacterium]MCC7142365.1 peptidylprolyl isomerase [Candidatus Eisenbacteria bacterium]